MKKALKGSGSTRRKGRGARRPKKKRVGLQFELWQMPILEGLARREGLSQLATFIHQDLIKRYPELNRRPGEETAGEIASDSAQNSKKTGPENTVN